MKRARDRWASSTRLHRIVTITTIALTVVWIAVYLVGSAVSNGSGYLDSNTSLVVAALAPLALAFMICNIVLGLRLTARLKARESTPQVSAEAEA